MDEQVEERKIGNGIRVVTHQREVIVSLLKLTFSAKKTLEPTALLLLMSLIYVYKPNILFISIVYSAHTCVICVPQNVFGAYATLLYCYCQHDDEFAIKKFFYFALEMKSKKSYERRVNLFVFLGEFFNQQLLSGPEIFPIKIYLFSNNMTATPKS